MFAKSPCRYVSIITAVVIGGETPVPWCLTSARSSVNSGRIRERDASAHPASSVSDEESDVWSGPQGPWYPVDHSTAFRTRLPVYTQLSPFPEVTKAVCTVPFCVLGEAHHSHEGEETTKTQQHKALAGPGEETRAQSSPRGSGVLPVSEALPLNLSHICVGLGTACSHFPWVFYFQSRLPASGQTPGVPQRLFPCQRPLILPLSAPWCSGLR